MCVLSFSLCLSKTGAVCYMEQVSVVDGVTVGRQCGGVCVAWCMVQGVNKAVLLCQQHYQGERRDFFF